jgi:hypothetical protein
VLGEGSATWISIWYAVITGSLRQVTLLIIISGDRIFFCGNSTQGLPGNLHPTHPCRTTIIIIVGITIFATQPKARLQQHYCSDALTIYSE